MGVVVKKRTRQLLIPYLWFVLLFFLVKWVFNYHDSQDVLISLKTTISSVRLFKNCAILHKSIWFLPVLFFMTILYRSIRYVKNRWLDLGIVLAVFLIGYILGNHLSIHLPFLSGTVLSSLIYFHFGYMIQKYEGVLGRVNRILLVVIVAIWLLLTMILEPEISYKNNLFPIYLPFIVIPPVIALFFLLKQHGDLKIGRPFKLAGLYSLGVLGYHALCNIVMDEINRTFEVSILPCIRLLAILFLVPIFIFISNRYIPYTQGKAKEVIPKPRCYVPDQDTVP